MDFAGAGGRHRHLDRAELDVALYLARFALIDAEFDVALIVDQRRIIADAACRDRCVAFDDRREQAVAEAAAPVRRTVVDAEREGADIGQADLLEIGIARFEAALHRGAERDGVVGMDRGIGEAAEHAGDRLAHDRHARAAADQDDLAQAFDADVAVAQRAQHGVAQPREQWRGLGFEFARRDIGGELAVARGDGEARLFFFAQGAAAAFGGGAQQFVQHHRVNFAQAPFRVDARAGDFDDRVVEILATEPVVAGRGANLDHAVENLDDRHVERAAAEIEDQERLLLLAALDAIGQRGGGRFVDQPFDGQAGEFAGAARRLALAVVEIGRHGDHRAGHGLAEECLGIGLQAGQHDCRQILGVEGLAAELDRLARTHPALERGDGRGGMSRLPVARRHADDHRAAIVDRDRRGREQIADRVGDQFRLSIAPHADRAVGRAKIDSDDH